MSFKLVLKNQKCIIDYDPTEKHISGTDLTDSWNIPRMYTTKRRYVSKAWKEIQGMFTTETTMGEVMDILLKNNTGPRSYCAMD